MDQKPAYIKSLTPMRGVAALWVVLFHIDVSTFYRDLGALISRDSTGILSKGYLWVDFFFLLSGFVITHVYGDLLSQKISFKNIKKFLWARFSRIYPLHFFTTVLLISAVLIVPYAYPEVKDGSWGAFFNWSVLPAHFLLTNAMTDYIVLSWNIPAWSIGAEWWAYVFSIFIFPFLPKRTSVAYWLLMLLSFASLTALVYWHPAQNLDITWDYGYLRCLFEFIIGIGVYRAYTENTGSRFLSKDISTVIAMLCISAIFHFELPDLIVIPVFALLLLSVAYNNGKVQRLLGKRAFVYLGEISYSIYLVHGLWFMFFWFCFPVWKSDYNITVLSVPWRIIYVSVFLLLTILSSHFTYHYVEVKARKFLRKFGSTMN